MSNFCIEKIVKARKDHTCCECNNGIKKCDEHTIYSGCYDGDMFRERMCNNCGELLTYVSDVKDWDWHEYYFGDLYDHLDGMDAVHDDEERQRCVSTTGVPHSHILNMRN